jgi:hypothetical protein
MRLLDHLKIPELNFYLIDIACPAHFQIPRKFQAGNFTVKSGS